jgi:DNA (cytosine-5)-methyltransferase 1
MIRQLGIPGITPAGLPPGEVGGDLFAGGGGWSEGFRRANGGVSPMFAVNHCEAAIEMHAANHPDSRHFRECVWKARPEEIVGAWRLGWLHASPDCTFFSQARGAKPMRDRYIRALPWTVVRWMKATRARIVSMENVREIVKWGPTILLRDRRGRPILDADGRKQWVPDPKRIGQTYREFIGAIKRLGYQVETRELNACDYGAPTARKRWYLLARNDGLAITWPAPTHGPGRRKPYRTAAECIDFSIPAPSIFMTRAEARAWRKRTGQVIRRPLAAKTMARIAEGLRRYVIEAAADRARGKGPGPYLVHINHGDHGWFRGQELDRPAPTVTGSRGLALVAPTMVQIGQRHGRGASSAGRPLKTIMPTQREALVTAFLAKHNRGATGQEPTEPLHTITGRDTKALIATSLVKMTHGDKQAFPAGEPLRTILAGANHHAVVAAHLTKFQQHGKGKRADAPLDTVMAGAPRFGVVAAFLAKYYRGATGQDAREPLHTATTHARFGVVTVEIEGETYAIVDIGMRMLTPRELARCQGFPDSYVLTGTQEQQIERIGNSVCPDVAAAIVAANLGTIAKAPRRRRAA